MPQALEGVAAVGVLYATVKRWFSPGAALLAGAVFALTPVAALMFRFNNPDALLVLLLVGARVRDDPRARGRPHALARAHRRARRLRVPGQGAAGVPRAARVRARRTSSPDRRGSARRIGQLVVLGVTTIVAGGWWVAIVQLTPASARPYIGGSQNNSFWNVLFGYNGFGRLTGNETGSVGGGGAGRPGRPVGPDRLDPAVQRSVRRSGVVAASRPR